MYGESGFTVLVERVGVKDEVEDVFIGFQAEFWRIRSTYYLHLTMGYITFTLNLLCEGGRMRNAC